MKKPPMIITMNEESKKFRFRDVKVGDMFVHDRTLYMRILKEKHADVYRASPVGIDKQGKDFADGCEVKHVSTISITVED